MFSKYTHGSRDLKFSITEGFFASIMLTAGAAFIVPFALFLGANSIEVGLLSAFPALLGSIVQLFSTRLIERFRSRKRLVVFFVSLQALSWLPIAFLPFIFRENLVFWLIVFYTAGMVAGGFPGPIWQSWMKSLIPSSILGAFFGFRSAIIGLFAFVILLFFGGVLQLFDSAALFVFCLIFSASVLGRLMSGFLFTKIRDEGAPNGNEDRGGFFLFVRNIRKTNFGYFVLYGSFMTFAVSMVGPFFAMYLLKDLRLDYFTYTIIVASSTVSAIISMPYWGRIVDRYGTVKALKATSLLMALYPLAYILVRFPEGLVVSEFFYGVIFSGFNLSLANFIYDASSQQKIIRYATYQNFFLGIATFFGLVAGGFILGSPFSFWIISSPFFFVCAISSAIRFGVYKALIGKVKEVKQVESIWSKRLVFSALALTPVREVAVNPAFVLAENGVRGIGNGLKKAECIGIKELKKAEAISRKELARVKDQGRAVLRAVEDGAKAVEDGARNGKLKLGKKRP